MNTIAVSDIFFIISSVGFVLLWVLGAIFLVYLIKAMKTFSRIMKRVEKDIDRVGDITKEMLEDVRESTAYTFLFKKKRKKRNNPSE